MQLIFNKYAPKIYSQSLNFFNGNAKLKNLFRYFIKSCGVSHRKLVAFNEKLRECKRYRYGADYAILAVRCVAGIMVQIVMAFSPLSNGAKILSCELQEEDSLTAVHGLRFLSLAWVIMVHTYLQVFAIAGTSQPEPAAECSSRVQGNK